VEESFCKLRHPQTTFITIYQRDATGKWIAQKYTAYEGVVSPEIFEVEFAVKEV
jgi:hypothetical protein